MSSESSTKKRLGDPIPFPEGSISFTYKYVGTIPVHATFVPAPNSSNPCPLFVTAHGGGLCSGSHVNYPTQWFDICRSRGWHCLTVAYQLLPPGNATTVIEDMTDLGLWISNSLNAELQSHSPDLVVDTAKIVVSGHSAGGYIAYQMALRFPPTAKPLAVFSMVGMSCDWGRLSSSDWYTSPKPKGYKWLGAKIPITDHTDEEFTELLADKTPVPDLAFEDMWENHPRFLYFDHLIGSGKFANVFGFERGTVIPLMDAGFPKTVIVHGNADTVVPIWDSKAVILKLESVGVECKLIVVDGADHNADMGGPEVVEGLSLVAKWVDA
ncbi:Alpha/Beta hydrolase protein [Cladochytrium replicatum]|nr:Alpha/Beta hydrolase protein [Cladochytrium replicatum]